MEISRFSNEIIKIGDTFVALSTIYAIGDFHINGIRGYGEIFWAFPIKTCLGADGVVTIFGNSIPYYELDEEEFYGCKQEEHPVFINKKAELIKVRDEVVDIWNEYLRER